MSTKNSVKTQYRPAKWIQDAKGIQPKDKGVSKAPVVRALKVCPNCGYPLRKGTTCVRCRMRAA